ncbi:MAG TPA: hypothetical protein DCQ28_10040 [Bacteroidetes bacterium]|nr:hypothetical protein [Bacteroidota bacterium]
MNKILHREIEVAFSKHSQPLWFRITKWILIIMGIYFFHDNEFFWWFIVFFTVIAFTVHFLWRYKTKGWTQSWIGWEYEKNKPK